MAAIGKSAFGPLNYRVKKIVAARNPRKTENEEPWIDMYLRACEGFDVEQK